MAVFTGYGKAEKAVSSFLPLSVAVSEPRLPM